MDALSGSAAIATSNSPISIFSPGKRRSPCRRRLHLVAASKDNEKDSDLSCDGGSANLVPFFKSPGSLTPLSNDAAMGLVLRAATGNGWTTDSGMEGPPVTFKDADSGSGVGAVSTFPWSLFTKSPRRRMRVAFTCNVCGQRTTRAINPHAYTDGTVFVQCCGCNVFHKLVDNLNLFHDMKCYVNPSFRHKGDAHFDFKDEDGDNIFPVPPNSFIRCQRQ